MTYVCPMHPEVIQDTPGRCPKCGMKLVPEAEASSHSDHMSANPENSYTPLYIIIGLISLVTAALAAKSFLAGEFMISDAMTNFMAGFFLVFSGFKLLDIKGFADGYTTYDLLAKKLPIYGLVYPFLELGLGILYATHITPPAVHIFTFILMSFSGLGVALKLYKGEQFQCACLGTFLKVPLTKVTLIENFGMALMALLML